MSRYLNKRRRAVRPQAGGVERARELRGEMSLPEVLLWQLLRRRGAGGLAFRRQKAFGPYVADFYCHEAMLVVEIDGKQHEGRVDEDRARDAWFAARGIAVHRVPAVVVLKDAAAGAARVLHEARKRITELEREPPR